MNAEIISVGNELILGDIANTDAQYLSKRLSDLGIDVILHTTINDDDKMIRTTLASAVSRSQVIIFTGGLGPTPDDLTKEAVCTAVGAKLVLHEETKNRIESYFNRINRQIPENNLKQAMLPEDAVVFLNDFGTASGCAISSGNQWIIMLPGPPKELIPMFDNSVIPYLSKIKNDVNIVIKTIKVFGMGESLIAEKIKDFLHYKNPVVATYVGEGEVKIKITARGTDKEKCNADCERITNSITLLLGDVIYSYEDKSLAEVVVKKLIDKKMKITTAESCTAGKLSAAITSVQGSSKVLELGVAAYSNDIKTKILGVSKELIDKYGVYSPEVAGAMAQGAVKIGGTKLGIGITGIASPDPDNNDKPAGLVYIALFDGIETYIREITVGRGSENEREYVRNMAVLNALDMCRYYLDEKYSCILNIKETPSEENIIKADPFLLGNVLAVNDSETADDITDIYSKSDDENKDINAVKKRTFVGFLKSWIPWKGDSRGELIRKSLLIVFAVVFLISATYLTNYFIESIRTKNANNSYKSEFYSNSDVYLNADGISSRFFSLLEKNPDTIGWLNISGTQADLPVVKSDNTYYLNHDFEGTVNKHGALFVDENCTITSTKMSRNITIYGHHMKDGTMFGELKKYRGDTSSGLSFYKENPTIDFTTIYQLDTTKWKIFSVFIANTDPSDDNGNIFDYMVSDFANDTEFDEFISEALKRSTIKTTVDVTSSDRILTLSTCIYDFDGARLVVMARKVRNGESDYVNVESAVVNNNIKFPAAYYGKSSNTYSEAESSKTTSSVLSEPSVITDASSNRSEIDVSSIPASTTSKGGTSSQGGGSSSNQNPQSSETVTSMPDSSVISSEQPPDSSEIQSSEISSEAPPESTSSLVESVPESSQAVVDSSDEPQD